MKTESTCGPTPPVSWTWDVGRGPLPAQRVLSGTKIDEIFWYGVNVQHTLNADTGYTVSLTLENKLPDDSVKDLVEEAR